MTTVHQSITNRTSSFLRRSVQVDAGLILIAGLFLIFNSTFIASFFGIDSPGMLLVAGAMVLLYDGGRLAWATLSQPFDRRVASLSLIGNAAWFVISVILLGFGLLNVSNNMWWTLAGLADFAGLFALLQWYGLRQG